jgi:DNA invertase Pin-like site-specific DNA recombinase
MVAQMERRFLKERQREGIERAKVAGCYRGGKRRIDHDKVRKLSLKGSGPAESAQVLGCSRMQQDLVKPARHSRGQRFICLVV